MERSEIEARLDKMFRSGSDARKAAEFLMDGKPHEIMEITKKVKTSRSNVSRAISMMKNDGLPIEDAHADDGRSKVVQLLLDGVKPRSAKPGASDTAIRSLWLQGEIVEIATEQGEFRFTFHDDGRLVVKTPQSEITLV